MLQPGIEILDAHRMMAISTVRPDGWPQTTMVGYANQGWTLYFLIFRDSQKFANIGHDDRVAIAVSAEASFLGEIKAVYAGAHAREVTDPAERSRAWQLLLARHPNLGDFGLPDSAATALMRADCKYVSVLDYSKGIGHAEELTVGGESAQQQSDSLP
ncbi:MAG TPA: pyridoxamine 5'-phosphate oxidase family protein [Sphingomicrobium sp.]|nr:pyridoxamine 5'-phosphate oxidase family protein [Sphingomicrobium sp.]